MEQGRIIKALSGFYYVQTKSGIVTCRARGRLRKEELAPLVGDWVTISEQGDHSGSLESVQPRKNRFFRPAVSNVDALVLMASCAVPVTDPFLIDRMISLAAWKGCESIVCLNKCDLNSAQSLFQTYQSAGFTTLRVSAETGEGIDALSEIIAGKVSAFTGNSGVGKSSILNALEPGFGLPVGEVSDKLGRGRHTTRHVELFRLKNGAIVADTPGFSSFDTEQMEGCRKEDLAATFREFAPYLDQCRFTGCAHVKEKGCAVLAALREGKIAPSRHESYVRLYEEAAQRKSWE